MSKHHKLTQSEIARRMGWSRQRLAYFIKKEKHRKIEHCILLEKASEGQYKAVSLRPDIKDVVQMAVGVL